MTTRLAIVPAPDEGWNTTLLVTEQSDVRPAPNPDTRRPDPPDGAVPAGRRGLPLDLAGVAPRRRRAACSTGPPVRRRSSRPTSRPPTRRPRSASTTRWCRAACRGCGSAGPTRCGPGAWTWPGTHSRCRRRRATDALAPPETFGRLEPVAAPVVVRRSPRPVPGVGDTAEVLVLRSDIDVPDKEVAEVDRLLFPGRVGPDLCELHGLPAGGADPGSYAELAVRDALDLADQTVTDPVSGEVLAGIGGEGRDRAGRDAAGGRLPIRPGDRRRTPRSARGRGHRRPEGHLAGAGDGPAGRRGRRGCARGQAGRRHRRTRVRAQGGDRRTGAELPRSPTTCSSTSPCGSG